MGREGGGKGRGGGTCSKVLGGIDAPEMHAVLCLQAAVGCSLQ